MALLLELLLPVFTFVGEILLQVLLQVLFELGLHGVAEAVQPSRPVRVSLALIGYALLGTIAGALSLWLLPQLFIGPKWLQLLNLALTPFAAGAAMAALGAWRRKRGEELIRLDRFGYGFVFALATTLVRYHWGT